MKRGMFELTGSVFLESFFTFLQVIVELKFHAAKTILLFSKIRVAVISAKNHKRQRHKRQRRKRQRRKRQRRKRQSVSAKLEKSQTPKVFTAILTLPNLT